MVAEGAPRRPPRCVAALSLRPEASARSLPRSGQTAALAPLRVPPYARAIRSLSNVEPAAFPR